MTRIRTTIHSLAAAMGVLALASAAHAQPGIHRGAGDWPNIHGSHTADRSSPLRAPPRMWPRAFLGEGRHPLAGIVQW